jgi:hypothetical protein
VIDRRKVMMKLEYEKPELVVYEELKDITEGESGDT